MQTQARGAALRVTSSPHIHSNRTTSKIMLDVILALLPAGAMGVVYFGWNALLLIAVSVVSAVIWEMLIQRALGRAATPKDLSAVVTGLLLAYNLPSTAPLWLAVVGSGIAIVLVKQLFGGLGQNFMNPALTARAILLASWVGHMSGTAFVQPGFAADAVSVATPLVSSSGTFTLSQLFLGNVPGCIGETCKLALLLGGMYLLARRVISWRVPVTMMLTVFVLFLLARGSAYEAMVQILSGGLILSAIFMATDYSSSPVTPLGRIIMGVGCGLILFVIRFFNDTYPEGCTYAILVMNMATPLIDRFTKPRVYGEVKARA